MYKGVIVDILKKPVHLKKPREKPGFFKKPGFYWVFSKKWVFFPTLTRMGGKGLYLSAVCPWVQDDAPLGGGFGRVCRDGLTILLYIGLFTQ